MISAVLPNHGSLAPYLWLSGRRWGEARCFASLLSVGYAVIFARNSSRGVVRNEMGNLESSAKINVDQLRGLSSRELNISRSLRYEEYQQVREDQHLSSVFINN